MYRYHDFKHFIYVFLLSVLLVACSGRAGHQPPPIKHPSRLQIRRLAADQLRQQGVQIIRLGETVKVVLSSDRLFNPHSANLQPSSHAMLYCVARYIHTFDTVNITIAAHTDNIGKRKIRQALTNRQAEVVANKLWSQHIDTRLIVAKGLNSLNPVSWNGSASGRSHNRRVEIKFHFRPRYKRYN